MNPTELSEKAIRKMNKKITNEVFLTIQNDRELMHDHLRAVEEHGIDTVNQTIGKEIKKIYGLQET